MKLASDIDNPEFVGAANPDSLLHVTFYSKPILQPFLSEQEGRPIFKDVDFVKIHTPGNQLNVIDVPADEGHKQRFPLHWARYQQSRGDDNQVIGTPVSQWPMITPSRAEELRAMKFFTVEQIANASDQQIQTLGMDAAGLRIKAQKFLEVAKGTAEVSKRDEELAKRDLEIEELRKQMAELMASQPKRGRPPKVEEAA